jgi:hypothetical protein
MTSIQSKRIVVDTSVARSVGETEHPVSSSCRKWLIDILEICHQVILSEGLNEEWKRHESKFTRIWKRSMAARGKPVRISEKNPINIDFSNLRPRESDAIKKDLCLIEPALSSNGDGIIVTCDIKIKELLEKSNPAIANSIEWYNPAKDSSEKLKSLHR